MIFNKKLKSKCKITTIALFITGIPLQLLAASTVLTNKNGTFQSSSENTSGSEVTTNLFDNNNDSKWLALDNTAWVSYQFDQHAILSSYSVTSANDAPTRDPQDWRLQGSNDALNWQVIDSQTAQVFDQRYQTKTYMISNRDSFSHYRLDITKNSGDNLIQLAEFALSGEYQTDPPPVDNSEILTQIDNGTVTFSEQIHAGEGATNLFDGNSYSKWLAQNNTAWVAYQFTKQAHVTHYTLTSANDAPDRDPKSWLLQGSNDGQQWTTLDSQSNQGFNNRYEVNQYTVNQPKSFSFYRLNITDNHGANYTQLAEVALIGTFTNTPPNLEASFTAQPTNIHTGEQVQYHAPDNMDSYSWYFEGGTPNQSSAQSPTVSYHNSGYFDASLTVQLANQSDTLLKPQLVVVSERPNNNVDITSDSGVLLSQYGSSISGEGLNELTDDVLTTKYVVQSASSWIEHKGDQNYIVTGYSITSANDAPPRDPKYWTLEGSNDGINYTIIDNRDNQNWTSRTETRDFNFINVTPYRYHRFNFTNHGIDEWGYDVLQIAELKIHGYGTGGQYPSAKMQFKNPVAISETVTFSSTGSKNAAQVLWQVQGQADSNKASPSYTFNQAGNYAISLTVTNAEGEKDITTGSIRVKQPVGSGNFVAPNINFVDDDPTHPGSIIFKQMIPDPVAFIQQHSETLARLIYDDVTPQLINNVENITYRLHDYDGISGKSGKTPNINISLSSRYIAEKAQQLGGETASILTELRGVLYHELTHGYQWEPVGAGGYAGGTEFYGFIEGLADYNRLTLGFHPEAVANKGGSHTSGYTTSAFFYVWLGEQYNIERFGSKLNETATTIAPWTLEKALHQIFINEGLNPQSVSELWTQYQNSL